MSMEDEFSRDTRAMERIAAALEAWVKLGRERFEKEFPLPKVKRDAELIRADERSEQYSDKPTDGWLEESPKDAEPSRFAKRLEESGAGVPAAQKRRTVEVPKGDGNNSKPS